MPRERPNYGPVIDPVTKDLRYVSVSQVGTFDPEQYGGCNRAWFFEKVLGKKKPKTAAQDIGDKVHDENERYLKTGEDALGPIARAGKHFLPDPLSVAPGILVEHEFGGKRGVAAFERWRAIERAWQANPALGDQAKAWWQQNMPSVALEAHNVPFVGYIDLLNLRDYWVDTEGTRRPQAPDEAENHDHKTTSDIERNAKSGAALADTVQMIGYAEYTRRAYPQVTKVRLSHGYLQTRGRGAEKRTTLISVDEIDRRWQRIKGLVLGMSQAAHEARPEDVEPNYDSCDAYATGCAHRSYCPRDPARVLMDLTGGVMPDLPTQGATTMSMLDAINSMTGAQAAPPPPPPCSCSPGAVPVLQQGENNTWWHMTAQPHVYAPAAAPVMSSAPVAASAPVMSSAPVAQPRVLVPLRDGLVLQHRERGYRVRMAAVNGGWQFQNVLGDGGLSAPAMAQPEQYDVATWIEIPGAPTGVTNVGPQTPAAPAPQRTTHTLANGMSLRHREKGHLVVFTWTPSGFRVQHADAAGQFGPPLETQPELWYTDVWEVASAPTHAGVLPTGAPVVPPDAPPSVAPGNSQPVPPGTTLTPPVAAAVAQHAASAPGGGPLFAAVGAAAPTAPTGAPAGGAAPSAEPAKSKRGRKGAAAGAATGVADTELTLFVDCTVAGFEVTDLEPYVNVVLAGLNKAAGIDDIRLAQGDHVYAYFRWKGALEAAVRAAPPAAGWYLLRHVDPDFKAAVVNAFRALGANVVEPVRR